VTSRPTTPRYGYHVPHLVLAGLVAGSVLLTGGVVLLASHPAPWFTALGGAGVAIGLGVLAFTAGLRWFVVHGRQLAIDRMLDAVAWTGAERVLDVGCGPGLALVGVAKRLTTGTVIGVDKWMVIHGERYNSKDITLENARIEGVADRVEVEEGDASAMRFGDETFDVAVSSFVFHHLPREVRFRALREMARVTKPGGRLLIADERTGELAATLRDLGMVEVAERKLMVATRLLSARKADVSAVVA
jgi:arsenite methyltransferase